MSVLNSFWWIFHSSYCILHLLGGSLYSLIVYLKLLTSHSASILLPSSLIIFKIITLNSFSDHLSPLHLVLLLEFYSLIQNTIFCHLILSHFMSIVDQLYFSTLDKWPSVGDVLCVLAVYSPFITEAKCSRGSPKRAARVLLCGLIMQAVQQAWLVDMPCSIQILLVLFSRARLPVGWLCNPGRPWRWCWLTGGQTQDPKDSGCCPPTDR